MPTWISLQEQTSSISRKRTIVRVVATGFVFYVGCWLCGAIPLGWDPERPGWDGAKTARDSKAMRAAGYIRGSASDTRRVLASVDCGHCRARAIGWIEVDLGPRGAVRDARPVALTKRTLARAGWISDAIARDYARLSLDWVHRDAESALAALLPLLPEGADE